MTGSSILSRPMAIMRLEVSVEHVPVVCSLKGIFGRRKVRQALIRVRVSMQR